MPIFYTKMLGPFQVDTVAPTGTLLRQPRLRFFDAGSLPLVGGKLYLCSPGSPNITTLKASWQDYGKTVLNPNPIILDSSGYASPIFSDTTYRAFLYSSQDSLITSYDGFWNTTLGLLQFGSGQYQFWDKNGVPLSGGKLYTCIPGAATLNQLKASFSDINLSILNPNPIILDSNGRAPLIYSLTDFYKLFLFDSGGVPVLSQDDVGPS